MLREDTRVAAVSSLIHPRDIPAASRWISVTKAAAPSGNQRKMHCNSPRRCPPCYLPLVPRPLTQPLGDGAFAQSPTFPCLSTVEHEVDRFDREQGREGGRRGGRRIKVSAAGANASRRNALAQAPR